MRLSPQFLPAKNNAAVLGERVKVQTFTIYLILSRTIVRSQTTDKETYVSLCCLKNTQHLDLVIKKSGILFIMFIHKSNQFINHG